MRHHHVYAVLVTEGDRQRRDLYRAQCRLSRAGPTGICLSSTTGKVVEIVSRFDFSGLEQDRLDEEIGLREGSEQNHQSLQ